MKVVLGYPHGVITAVHLVTRGNVLEEGTAATLLRKFLVKPH